ncbi:hypothetical protein [Tsukamurella ocularis]|uniref:hypothetical protein n=1 Tax=Tsukamurella ocularis TaxID=1970234 RepID=UPI0021677378|nr:hypothetical protein [Tsukamurella ocularis]MCS3779364.1 hypothetical protein [Tsukamurella ocularis]MCS3789906.1 hypothetical protein [Tsukamurella ocularis]
MTAIINLEANEYRIPGVLDELPEIMPSNIVERREFLRRHDDEELRGRIHARREAAVDMARRWLHLAEVCLCGDFDPDEPGDLQAFEYAADNVRKLLAEAARLDELLKPPAERQ